MKVPDFDDKDLAMAILGLALVIMLIVPVPEASRELVNTIIVAMAAFVTGRATAPEKKF